MSRFTKELEDGRTVAYGYDHALGYFIDVFSKPDKDDGAKIELEESSLITKMSNGKMIELMDSFKLPESHIELVAMDLPIE
jgi:hypothetical protein